MRDSETAKEGEGDAEVGGDVFPDGDDAWKVTDEKQAIRQPMLAIQLFPLVYSHHHFLDKSCSK